LADNFSLPLVSFARGTENPSPVGEPIEAIPDAFGIARITVNAGHSIAYPIAEKLFPEISRLY
jgi:hypothetical protein